MFAAAVSHHDNNINTRDGFVVNVIFWREEAAIAWGVAHSPSDSIELGEVQTVF